MAKRGCIVDDMRVPKAGVKGWLAWTSLAGSAIVARG